MIQLYNINKREVTKYVLILIRSHTHIIWKRKTLLQINVIGLFLMFHNMKLLCCILLVEVVSLFNIPFNKFISF
jgi:hypothetical protein